MKYRTLGRTGIVVSEIALGCEGFIKSSKEESLNIINYALNNGVNFFDIYTPNPYVRDVIGNAIEGSRERVIIQGHLGTLWTGDAYVRTRDKSIIEKSFYDMLYRLKTTYIDIGMLYYIDKEEEYKRVFESDIYEYVKTLKSDGVIRAIGMSSHNPNIALRAVDEGVIDVLMFSINPAYDLQPADEDCFKLFDNSTYKGLLKKDVVRLKLYEACQRNGVGIDVMKAFGGGNLLNAQASPFGKALTPIQCIAYALDTPAVASVMLGCHSVKEVDDALGLYGASLEQLEYESVIRCMIDNPQTGYCMYCGHCQPCSSGIDIAMINKLISLCVPRNFVPETVREHYDMLSIKASACIGCRVCETRCPFEVDIVSKMREAIGLFGK